jgi:hypothetical protein
MYSRVERATAAPALAKGRTRRSPTLRIRRPTVLLGLLEARLGHERLIGAVFAALLDKHGGDEPVVGGPTRGDLERMRDDELRRIELLQRAIVELGGERRAQPRPTSPRFNSKVGAIIADPRGNLGQALDALAAVELASSDAWMILADLTAEVGRHEIAASFTRAMADTDRQLLAIRGWSRRLASARPRP